MVLKDVGAVTPFGIIQTDITIENGKIAEIFHTHNKGKDCTGMLAFPGFIDTHIHGGFGTEFSAPKERFDGGLTGEAHYGVTGVCCTVRCLPVDETVAAIKNIVREYKRKPSGARIEGIHLEGPFVSPDYSGSMNVKDMVDPDPDILQEFYDASHGLLKIITVAPELKGADALILKAKELGITVSMGHTGADKQQALHAYLLGARQFTHTFNACAQFHHRSPNAVGFALTKPDIKCEAICDLVHLDLLTVRLIFAAKGDGFINMISDSGVFAGMGDGDFVVAGQRRHVKDGICTLDNGRIAGSCFTLYHGVRNLLKAGFDPMRVWKAACHNPAETLRISHRAGMLLEKRAADICVLDRNYNIALTMIGGDVYEERIN
ncbi:MAG: N-acetylglucosamine-6-phosphate deacetylase [Clostridia bacterium]|nr:N-acetylglucosamine-6-phosphate deacetylase [Clostridia bacterium]